MGPEMIVSQQPAATERETWVWRGEMQRSGMRQGVAQFAPKRLILQELELEWKVCPRAPETRGCEYLMWH